jgi:hypothetical protein
VPRHKPCCPERQQTAEKREVPDVIENVGPNAVLFSAHVAGKQKSENQSSGYTKKLNREDHVTAVLKPNASAFVAQTPLSCFVELICTALLKHLVIGFPKKAPRNNSKRGENEKMRLIEA